MSIVTAVITTTTTPLPAGVTFDHYRYEILAADGVTIVQTGNATTTTFSFPADVAAGSYTAQVQAIDSTGATLGVAASAPFTVAPSTGGTFEQPATVTVTLS
jgi:predicted phage tail protein